MFKLFIAGDNPITSEQEKRNDRIQGSEITRPTLYRTYMNADLSVHEVYSEKSNIPEYHRVSFTRLRLCSHNLMIERGRWSRIRREDRKCVCGAIQTEQHVLLECPVTQDIRNVSQLDTFVIPELFTNEKKLMCKYCHDVLTIYQCAISLMVLQ